MTRASTSRRLLEREGVWCEEGTGRPAAEPLPTIEALESDMVHVFSKRNAELKLEKVLWDGDKAADRKRNRGSERGESALRAFGRSARAALVLAYAEAPHAGREAFEDAVAHFHGNDDLAIAAATAAARGLARWPLHRFQPESAGNDDDDDRGEGEDMAALLHLLSRAMRATPPPRPAAGARAPGATAVYRIAPRSPCHPARVLGGNLDPCTPCSVGRVEAFSGAGILHVELVPCPPEGQGCAARDVLRALWGGYPPAGGKPGADELVLRVESTVRPVLFCEAAAAAIGALQPGHIWCVAETAHPLAAALRMHGALCSQPDWSQAPADCICVVPEGSPAGDHPARRPRPGSLALWNGEPVLVLREYRSQRRFLVCREVALRSGEFVAVDMSPPSIVPAVHLAALPERSVRPQDLRTIHAADGNKPKLAIGSSLYARLDAAERERIRESASALCLLPTAGEAEIGCTDAKARDAFAALLAKEGGR